MNTNNATREDKTITLSDATKHTFKSINRAKAFIREYGKDSLEHQKTVFYLAQNNL